MHQIITLSYPDDFSLTVWLTRIVTKPECLRNHTSQSQPRHLHELTTTVIQTCSLSFSIHIVVVIHTIIPRKIPLALPWPPCNTRWPPSTPATTLGCGINAATIVRTSVSAAGQHTTFAYRSEQSLFLDRAMYRTRSV